MELKSPKESTLVSISEKAPDWTMLPVSDFALDERNSFVNGPFGSDLLTSELEEEGVPVIYIRDIAAGDFRWKSDVYVTEEKADSLSACRVGHGDLLLVKVGDPPCVSAVYEDSRLAIITQDVIRIRTGSIDDSEYLAQVFKSDVGKRQVKRIVIAGTRDRVSLTDLKKMRLPMPPPPQRRSIARILRQQDALIRSVEKLIEICQKQKRALIQQLLTGKRRLPVFLDSDDRQDTKYGDIPADWSFPQIGEVAHEVSERNDSGEHQPVLSCSKHAGFVNSLEYFKKKVYSDDTSNYKVIRNGDFGFPSNHIEEGSIGYQDLCDLGIVSPIYTIFRTDGAMHDGYLYKLLKTEHYRQIFAANTNASVDRRGSLRWKEFSKIRVPMPSYEEQAAISAVIDQEEAVKANYEAQKISLENQKKALMQQLLTGKRRVKVDKEAA